MTKLNYFRLFLIFGLLTLSGKTLHAQTQNTSGAQVQAQEEERTLNVFTNTYSPDYCDFQANFPEPPLITQHCEDPNDTATCFQKASYTKVFDLSASVKFDIICNPASEEMYGHFEPDAMLSTVKAMTKDIVLETFNTHSQQEEGYRHAGLVGVARQGVENSLYISQLWITPKSIMSVEARMTGAQNKDADFLFASLLSNIIFAPKVKPAPEEPVTQNP